MSIVTLVSGGLDSTLMAKLAKEERVKQYPLFVDYGQRANLREWLTCRRVFDRLKLPPPARMDLRGFGKLVPSGLTNVKLRLNEDAFLPGRNLLLLLAAASYAYSNNCTAIAIGLLTEHHRLFPDQTKDFLRRTERLFQSTYARSIHIVTPLFEFTKKQVVEIAKHRRISGTYSCHSGKRIPCGRCISCLEFIANETIKGGNHGR